MDVERQLETALFDPTLSRSERIAAINELGDVRELITSGLAASVASEAWERFERWLFAAFTQPSTGMAALLGDVLNRHNPEVNNEDIVEVLGAIADPASVAALESALLWAPEWDEFHALGIK